MLLFKCDITFKRQLRHTFITVDKYICVRKKENTMKVMFNMDSSILMKKPQCKS